MPTTSRRTSWPWIAGAGLAVVAVAPVVRHALASVVTGCAYPPPGPPPLPRTPAETVRRIHARIVEANPSLDVPRCAADRSCAWVVAEALAQAQDWQLPPDLVTAIAWQESRFNLHIDNIAERVAEGREIGPLQVRPIAFRSVGMDPMQAITLPVPARVAYVVAAGLAYLHRLRTHYLPGATWCSVLHAYNVGPTAYRLGRRNQNYVNNVIRQALRYTELGA